MDDFLYVNDKSVDEAYISKDKSAIWRQFHLGISLLMIFPLQH